MLRGTCHCIRESCCLLSCGSLLERELFERIDDVGAFVGVCDSNLPAPYPITTLVEMRGKRAREQRTVLSCTTWPQWPLACGEASSSTWVIGK